MQVASKLVLTTVVCSVAAEFNEGNVPAAMKKLRNNLSAGPVGFPKLMFKRLKRCFATPHEMWSQPAVHIHLLVVSHLIEYRGRRQLQCNIKIV